MREAKDMRMGMCGHSNQPAPYHLHVPVRGTAVKAQISEVLERLYIGSEVGQGYPGDEDNGEMSAWYIFSALGLYPLRVGSPEYAIGALVPKATVHLKTGSSLSSWLRTTAKRTGTYKVDVERRAV